MLRKVRIGISLVVILLFLLTFLGGEKPATLFAKPLLFMQFTPSVVKWILAAGGGVSLGFLLILLVTIVFGRVYCACLCPLGILQDGMLFVARKLRRKKAFTYQTPHPYLRDGILVATLMFSIVGTLTLLNLLEPYSLFGRIMIHFWHPLVVLLNNLLVSILEVFGVYTLAAIPRPPILVFPLLVTLGFCFLLLGMVIWRGRLYCNTLCPLGTLLGLVSRFAFYKISLAAADCIRCGRCEKKCRAGCIDAAHKTIDASRCVVCGDCLASCPKAALAYTHPIRQARPDRIDPARRKLLTLAASAAGSLMVFSLPLRSVFRPLLPTGKTIPIVPPGALSVDHFTAACTACDLCVNVCPARAIQPAFGAYGLRGVLQPTMDYKHGYCVYECNACGQICPTGAITPLPLAEKKLTQIGQTRLIKDLCLVYAKKQECGACVEVCPTHAVYTEERDAILYPETKVEHCTGCGRCELVCPVIPKKAIFVEGNAVHARALEPYYVQPSTSKPSPQKGSGDFPF